MTDDELQKRWPAHATHRARPPAHAYPAIHLAGRYVLSLALRRGDERARLTDAIAEAEQNVLRSGRRLATKEK